jgi:hypothetical protein
MANPFPFVAGQVLTAAQMNGIGEAAVTFTPTFTGYTRGNGTSVAYYMQVNKLVYIYVKETLGSTSSVTGRIRITLPVTASRVEAIQLGRSRIEDVGITNFVGTTLPDSTTTVDLFADLTGGTYTEIGSTSATVPMTWVNTDNFSMSFVYEAA